MTQNQSAREEIGGGDVIALVDPSKWDHPGAPQLAYANGWNEALRLSSGGQGGVHSVASGSSIPTALPDGLLDELERLALAATPGDLDTVPSPPTEYGGHDGPSWYECPACNGQGEVEGETYTNFDGEALGVQFFGMGNAHKSYEAFFRAANPATVLKLIEALRATQVGISASAEMTPNPSNHPQQQG